MPVRKTSSNCYQYGKTGKVYCGKDAKEKAEKQGKAIQSQKRKDK